MYKRLIQKELFEEWGADLDREVGIYADWIIVDTDFLEEDEDGEYPFETPNFYELVKKEKYIQKKEVSIGELKADDFKLIAEALYGLDPKLMQEEGFSIAALEFIALKERGIENPAKTAEDLLDQLITEIEKEEKG